MTSCYYCGGALKEELTTFVYQGEAGQVYLVKNVPALVCQKCGEKEYSQEVTHRVVTLLRQSPLSYEVVHVPVYDLAHVGA